MLDAFRSAHPFPMTAGISLSAPAHPPSVCKQCCSLTRLFCCRSGRRSHLGPQEHIRLGPGACHRCLLLSASLHMPVCLRPPVYRSYPLQPALMPKPETRNSKPQTLNRTPGGAQDGDQHVARDSISVLGAPAARLEGVGFRV